MSMHYVGIDLAWGERRPTGLAVLDADGVLLAVSAVRTDEEIEAALASYVEGECLVAIDAPLIVRNATGNRPAEKQLNKDFARFDAGAHPSNTGKPEFSEQPRAARVAARLGLDINPWSRRPRRGIEVYPHPATVALFRLGRTLKYKDKPGRDLEHLRAELLVLMRLVEGLASAEPSLRVEGPAWRALHAAVVAAARKSELRVVEDQVDAVVCAYIARFADLRREDTVVYGDLDSGYIVTPALPDDLVPTPRQKQVALAAATPAVVAAPDIGAAVREYAEGWPAVRDATDRFVALVTSVLDEAGINYLTVTGRAKSVTSFAAKAARTAGGHPVYADPLREVTDQVGVRVITYVHSDVQAVADLLADQVTLLDDRDMGRETASEGRFGYASRHLLVKVDDMAATNGVAQVQIRTVLQHAWAEFEHDIRYKGTIPDEHVPDFDRRFTLAAGLLELADREFSIIRERIQPGFADEGEPVGGPDDDPRIPPRELAAFLAGQYADAGWSRTDHYVWMATIVLELGITSLSALGEVLRQVDADLLRERMGYRYPPGAVRRLDDALLWTYGEEYVELRANADRVGALRSRLARMRGGLPT
ncbi:putative RNase H-like nuclease/ppGpp synthetase/RelA/SpoT-type nucleotidyltransferase [Nocardioides aromaticivorans]|uniref:Putative RNase H-like nuclease/ppGpp synthetase/RelA/SpoT-type nucleotidyltransferase n=1 Tax=Nocardioides aromaticivorans TaxID=200618 RepID=A0A7Z0CJF0_9ACTN|nr:DUF429 domain-containing protein [Nocardioides aromaticivorans]NYI42959.1 putative RNase H-like nuclease/ppGpp synthetase/RelA/SpoT-type nucleotidyltransferase [Nocardioides aromaticivorans]